MYSEGPGIESRWGRDFPHPSRPALGAHPASYTIGTGSFPGIKRPGRGVDHPLLPSAEVKEWVGLYLYSPSGPSWPVIGWNLPLFLLPNSSHPLWSQNMGNLIPRVGVVSRLVFAVFIYFYTLVYVLIILLVCLFSYFQSLG